jgi:hypothetical protein
MESDDFRTIHFVLGADEQERVRQALKKENSKRQTPIAKNPFAKQALIESVQRRGC